MLSKGLLRMRAVLAIVLSAIMAFGGVPTGAIADEVLTTEVVAEQQSVGQPIVAQNAGDIATGTQNECSWRIEADGNLTIYPTNGVSGVFASVPYCSFSQYKSQVTSVTFAAGVHATNLNRAFEFFDQLKTADLSHLDTSECTSFGYVFSECCLLESIDLTGVNTSNATSMEYMFNNCGSLQSIDVSGFNTSNVKNMEGMFCKCGSLQSIDVAGFNTPQVSNMRAMFGQCTALTSVDLSSLDTHNVLDIGYMFTSCTSLESVNVSGMDISSAANANTMFNGCTNLATIATDGTTDLGAVFPYGMGSITVVDTSDPNPPKTSISAATVTGVDGWTYDATAHTLTPVVTLGGTALQSGRDYTLGGDVSARDAGDYTLTITGAGDYEGTVSCPYAVAAKPVTVSADDKTKVAGQGDPQLTATVAGTCAGETVTYRLWRQSGEMAGDYTIGVSGDASQGSYALTFSPGTLTITADPQNPEELSILERLRKEYTAAQNAADQAASAADALREELEQAQGAYDLVVQGNEALVEQVRGAADELAAANATLAEATAAKEAATAAEEQNESQITELGNNITVLQGAVGTAEQDVLAAQGNVDARQQARDAASGDVDAKQQAYESACEAAAAAG